MSEPKPPRSPRELAVTRLASTGEGVAEGEGAPIRVRGALPGERIRVGPSTRRRGTLTAPLLEVLAPSADRRAPACTVVERCGGCPMAHLTRDAQLAIKEGWLRDALARCHVSAPPIERVAPAPSSAYRVRARLAWERREGASAAAIGYRAASSHAIVPPERCEVLAPPLERARGVVSAALAPLLEGTGELRVGLEPDLERVVVALDSEAPQPRALHDVLERLIADGALRGASVRVGGASVATRLGDAVERSRDVDGRALEATIGSFRQGHASATDALGRRVLALGAPEGVDAIELHAGHGHFTLSLAARARDLVAVELDPDAARALRINLEAHALGADVRCTSASEALGALTADVARRRRSRPSLVVLDPPRSGAAELAPLLVELGPERIVYVSCGLESFARDAGKLAARFELDHLTIVDLFPDTLHVELVARFLRREAR